jgi:hypothetical protein
MRDAGALFLELVQREVHPLAREVVDVEALDDLVLAVRVVTG